MYEYTSHPAGEGETRTNPPPPHRTFLQAPVKLADNPRTPVARQNKDKLTKRIRAATVLQAVFFVLRLRAGFTGFRHGAGEQRGLEIWTRLIQVPVLEYGSSTCTRTGTGKSSVRI
ncbi:unnamed protein product [Tuber aestivum]|uniref:Uncharacterized protein n=1 Tax=Tuber aestivum TaxID=59557 RepID=A0A292Q7W8_9PEZI|nr:unnamed protein product [Tuber aestivum]